MLNVDVVVIGAGFAGLACAKVMAEQGLSVVVLERKKDLSKGIHTTGILVKEAVHDWALPDALIHRITSVKLYSPKLDCIHLQSNDDYFFLATDTPKLMCHLAHEAAAQGVQIFYDSPYDHAERINDHIVLASYGIRCRYLVGADGAESKVAKDFSLGQNKHFLLGVEAEFAGHQLEDTQTFHCFLDQTLAKGYLAWMIPGVGITQVGLATKLPAKPNIHALLKKLSPLFSLPAQSILARRGGLIPVGGLVRPFANDNVFLVGDAAGIVSPLTAGGIHTALHYGKMLGQFISDFHQGRTQQHPSISMDKCYPRFYHKQILRWCLDHMAPNWLLNPLIKNTLFQSFAKTIFFRQKRLR